MRGRAWAAAALGAAIVISSVALPRPGSSAAAASGGAVYLPNVTKTLGGPAGWTTAVAIQNTGQTASAADVSLYRFADGSLVTTIATPSLAPGQAWTLDPLAYAQLPDDTQFSAVVRPANGQAAAAVLEGSGASWMSYSGTTSGAATVYLPNVLRRLGGADGWSTPFVVQNVGDTPATASVLFYRFSDGTLAARIDNVALDPGRGRPFLPWTIDGLVDGGSYSVVVQGAAGAQLWAIVNEHQAAQAMSYEGLLAGAERVFLPNVTKYLGGTDGWSTPFVVQNLGTAAASFTLAFYPFGSGALALRTPSIALDPGRSYAADVRFTPAGLAAGQYGVVVEGAPGARLGAVVNEQDLAGGHAMSYVGATGGQPSSYLPDVRKNAGGPRWVSPIIAQNLGSAAADVTVTLFDARGAVASQQRYPQVAAGAAVVYDPRFDAALPDGAYSALVQSAGAVAAVVNHSSLAVQGDYAFAYGGTPGPAVPVPVPPPPAAVQTIGGFTFNVVAGARVDVYVEAGVATPAATLADRADADAAQLQSDFAQPFAKRPQLFYFATSQDFAAGRAPVLGDPYPGTVGTKQEGLFVPTTGRIGLDVTTLSLYTVRHELTHLMVRQIIGPTAVLPQWFDEGLARSEEYTFPGTAYYAAHDRYGAASMAINGGLLSLDTLADPNGWFQRDDGPAGDYQYDEAVVAIRFIRDDAGADAPTRIITAMGKGAAFADAFAAATGRTYATFAATYPDRVRAIAPSAPGGVSTTGPGGAGLAFVLYGFSPSTPIDISVVWNDVPSTTSHSAGSVDAYGRWDQFVGPGSLAGTYRLTAVGANGTVTLTATKP